MPSIFALFFRQSRRSGFFRLILLVLLSFFVWGGVVRAENLAPLKIGIMPFNSTLALIKTHQPLSRYLETQLGRHIAIHTSADYTTFVNELLGGQFDLAIAGPHFGSMAQQQGWIPLFRYQADLQPVFVVRADSSIKKLEELRGKSIGLSGRLSISSIGGMKWLQDSGLTPHKDYQLVERTTHGAAIAAVAVGELDAALTTHTPLKQIPEDIRAKIKVLPLNIHIPHLMTLAHSRLGPQEIERIRGALRKFPDTAEGREFFRETGYGGYVDVTPADIQALKPFVDITVQLMRQGK